MQQYLDSLKGVTREGGQGINLNPLQRGGLLYPEAKRVLNEWADGYSICDYCNGRLDQIRNPPIHTFVHEVLPRFLEVDVTRITNGAREAKFLVMHAVCKPGDTIVIDGNAHYTSYLAAERNALNVCEIPHSGYPSFLIDPEAYADTIEAITAESGQRPALTVLTYPDGNYGNLVNVTKVARISHDYDIPLLLNAAYSMGRMPLSAKQMGCDFIVGSGHKSMAATGPIGILGVCEEQSDVVLRISGYAKNKEIELLGCTARGATIMTLMASFPHVRERVTRWDEEVKKARWFSRQLETLDFTQLGQRPHNHDLLFLESPLFYAISKKHPKKRYFLYQALKQRGISGIKAGLTKHFKLSSYQLSDEALNQVVTAFDAIITANRRYL